ncbi:hypothetical protein [Dokdonella sp.]|uniref:hypothetical protein n=1 Tax=Dokdonella sp. TaxID=2291710 RepID=UPI0025BE5EEB|nr:hypothetical protein [Dokdonella sp.]MBX3692877.1 hypothetical protein [Dokdonella sp.]MCW5566646.1 hypothetical protein [Dokdonella sp.]
MRRFPLVVFTLLLACACGLAFSQVAIPELRTRITDTTGTLDAAAIARIEAPLSALEAGQRHPDCRADGAHHAA